MFDCTCKQNKWDTNNYKRNNWSELAIVSMLGSNHNVRRPRNERVSFNEI